MRNFFGHGITDWTRLRDSLHVYVLADEALRTAVAGYQAAIETYPDCAVQPPDYLHATVQRLPWFCTDLSTDDVARLTAALADRLGPVAPFTVELDRPVVNDGGVNVHTSRSASWDVLVDTVREAAVAVLGSEPPLGRPPFGPHVSLGYAIGDGDNTVLQSALDRMAGPGPLLLRVEEVHLLSVHQHPDAGTFTWDAISTAQLGRV